MADLIEGITFDLGGEILTIPPLTFKLIKLLTEDIEAITSLKEPGAVSRAENMDRICKIIHYAIQRNYPDKTFDWVEERLDMGNAADILREILSGSGIKERRAGEAKTQSR